MRFNKFTFNCRFAANLGLVNSIFYLSIKISQRDKIEPKFMFLALQETPEVLNLFRHPAINLG